MNSRSPNAAESMQIAYFAKLLNDSGLFKESEYPMLMAARIAKQDPATHYLMVGEGRGIRPSRQFDPEYYLTKYPAVRRALVSPAIHFLQQGRQNGLRPMPMADEIPFPAFSKNPKSPTNLVLCGGGALKPSVAGLLAWNVVNASKGANSTVAVFLAPDALLADVKSMADSSVSVGSDHKLDQVEIGYLVKRLMAHVGQPETIYVFDLRAAAMLSTSATEKIPFVCAIQDPPRNAEEAKQLSWLLNESVANIFLDDAVRKQMVEVEPRAARKTSYVLSQGMLSAPNGAKPEDLPAGLQVSAQKGEKRAAKLAEVLLEISTLSRIVHRKADKSKAAEDAAAGPVAPDFVTEAKLVQHQFDAEWYLASFTDDEKPADPLRHYLEVGWKEGRDPARWFSTRHYIARYEDVRRDGTNPFVHFVTQGNKEGRFAGSGLSGQSVAVGKNESIATGDAFKAQQLAVAKGEHFESPNASIAQNRVARAKVIAYYLPQFHDIPENDEFWGKGFTEWRNVARGMPRYEGHIQPRIPGDLGFYNLDGTATYRRQIELARQAGLFGFCFYYYWFNQKRVLDKPVEHMLSDPSLDFPFCLMWANENWTRTWDGHERNVLLKQDYLDDDDQPLVQDLARHFHDPRYIKLDGRPVFIIYRPGAIPDSRAKISRWRKLLREKHDCNPIIMMAQAFGDADPRLFGLDGAIEFPPHKIAQGQRSIRDELAVIDPEFKGHVISYDEMVDRALSEPAPDYPLVRCVTPNWDNEPRRPGRGMSTAGSTPDKFNRWSSAAIEYSIVNPTFGNSIVAVNAWNEWAEGAYLEPDVHFGHAYLNALSRAIHGVRVRSKGSRCKMLIVGHDAHRNGAQMLALNIGTILSRQFGVEVNFILGDTGPLIDDYKAIGPVHLWRKSDADLNKKISALQKQGFSSAICNTTVVGWMLPSLKAGGVSVISLIHELGKVLKDYSPEDEASKIAYFADHLIFPAGVVRDSFLAVSGPSKCVPEIYPQGLYKEALLFAEHADAGVRAEFGFPEGSELIINVGYGDLRKGIDRFVETAISMCSTHPNVCFLWVGDCNSDAKLWFWPAVEKHGLSDRIKMTGFSSDVERYYLAADVFYFTSREDPFPSVILEALAAGLPIVGYSGVGGSDQLIAQHGDLLQSSDTGHAATAIAGLLSLSPGERAQQAAIRRKHISDDYRFDRYCFGLLERSASGLQTVSAVIPNYNYERYIAERINSILEQTYPLFQTIVLDDVSTDKSVEEIHRTIDASSRSVVVDVSQVNSGSPFVQWKKGADMSRGEYVWIAEADDLAAPEMLDSVVAAMESTGAVLGFCDSWQMGSDGQQTGTSYKAYMNEFEPAAFDADFCLNGEEFLARFLAVKNVILNVSAVVFRRDALLQAFAALGDELFGFKVAGDWRLYAELCRLGRVAYVAKPLNGHRRHEVSVTHSLAIDTHLAEIKKMQEHCAGLVQITDRVREAQAKHYENCVAHLNRTKKQ